MYIGDLSSSGILYAGSHFMMWSFLIISAPLLYGCWIVSVESQTTGEPAWQPSIYYIIVIAKLKHESRLIGSLLLFVINR